MTCSSTKRHVTLWATYFAATDSCSLFES